MCAVSSDEDTLLTVYQGNKGFAAIAPFRYFPITNVVQHHYGLHMYQVAAITDAPLLR